MKIEIKKDELVKYLVKSLKTPELTKAMNGLKEIDWNPFDDDGDEYDTAWKEIVHNKDLVFDAAVALAHTAERLVIEGKSLSAPQKHDAVVSALDKAIALPFFMEPFDGKVIDLIVTGAVKFMNLLRKSKPAPEVEVPVKRVPRFIAGQMNKAVVEKTMAPKVSAPVVKPINISLTKKGKFKEIG